MMKNLIILLTILVFIANCGNEDKKNASNGSDKPVLKQGKSVKRPVKPDKNPELTDNQATSDNYKHSKVRRDSALENEEKIDISLLPKVGENLLVNCLYGSSLRRCELHSGLLTDKFEDLTTHEITYAFNCKSQLPHFGVCTDYGCVNIRKFGVDTLSIKGVGPLILKDFRPRATKRFSFTRDCKFIITEIISKPI